MINKPKCCLLLEDDPEQQEIFIDALHSVSSNTGCYAVSNGEEALSILLNEGITPDYIFSDINMPKMDGFQFLKAVKGIEGLQNIPVIIYSSDYSEKQIAKATRLGATAIFSKDNTTALERILRKYLCDASGFKTIL
jgi:CheY-like chemotaxis protein